MASHSNGRMNGPIESEEVSGEHWRAEDESATPCDPVLLGLERVLVGVSVLLLVGIVIMAAGHVSERFDWDAPVVGGGEDRRSLAPSTKQGPRDNVIRFDMSRLNSEGLIGPADGLRSLGYEFCIPASEQSVGMVESIDPTAEVQRQSLGRIGCGSDEFLVLGNTHQADFEGVLVRLSKLPFVDRIEEAQFE